MKTSMSSSVFVIIALCLFVPLIGCQNTSSTPSEAAVEEAATTDSPLTGKKAPDFSLVDQNNQTVRLSEQQGKWVILYFYPKDDTPGCVCQATEFTELLYKFRDMNAEIYGISEDTPESHRMFIDKYDLKLTLLSDPDHRVMERYGAWAKSALNGQDYGRIIRSTVLVDPEGVVRYHWPYVIPQGHAERIREKLSQFQKGEAVPKK